MFVCMHYASVHVHWAGLKTGGVVGPGLKIKGVVGLKIQ